MEPQPTPAVMPEQPNVPPPQTAQGTLHDMGLPILTNYVAPSSCVTPDDPRWEFTQSISSKSLSNTIIHPHWIHEFEDASNRNQIWPAREYALASSMFHDVSFDVMFYAVKPPDTTGKILIEEYPDGRYNLEHLETYKSGSSMVRSYKHYWDVGASPMFNLTFTPPAFLNHRPTRYTANSDWVLSPFLLLNWLTPYMCGSIYPDDFDIWVFTRWNFTPYVPVLPHMKTTMPYSWLSYTYMHPSPDRMIKKPASNNKKDGE